MAGTTGKYLRQEVEKSPHRALASAPSNPMLFAAAPKQEGQWARASVTSEDSMHHFVDNAPKAQNTSSNYSI